MFDYKVLVENLPVITAFALSISKTEKDEAITAEIKEAFDNLDLQNPPDIDEALASLLSILEEVVDLTPSQIDNVILSVAKTLTLGGSLNLFARFRAKRRAKVIKRKMKRQDK